MYINHFTMKYSCFKGLLNSKYSDFKLFINILYTFLKYLEDDMKKDIYLFRNIFPDDDTAHIYKDVLAHFLTT